MRKVHNNRFDSKKAALIGLKPDLKVSLMPSDLALNCRNLCREYYDLMDNRSAYVNKLKANCEWLSLSILAFFSKLQLIQLLHYWKLIPPHLPLSKKTSKRL